MNPVDELCAAAATLRKLAAAIHAPDLDDQAWHTEECADEEKGDCPCIVAQGSYSWHDEPSKPLYYVADAETPELAAYIAAMGPDVGVLLADWLDYAAHYHESAIKAADDVFRDDPAGHAAFLTTGPGQPSPHALNIARQINTRSQP